LTVRPPFFLFGGFGSLLLILAHKLEYLFPFYVGLAALAMGWLVWAAAPGKRINSTYLFLTLALYSFALSLFLFSTARFPSEALFWLRAGAIFGLATSVALFYFAVLFPKVESRPTLAQLALWGTWGGLALGISFTGLLFEKAVITPDGNGFNLGLGSPIYLFFILTTAGAAIQVLRRKQRLYFGASRLQVGYVILGGFLALTVPLLCNLVLPVLGFNQLLGYGPFFLLTLSAFGYYAILKHRLMSLEIVIRQITVYASSALLSVLLFLIIVLFGQAYFAGRPGFGLLTFSAFDALLIAIIYQPLVSIAGRVADRLFFRGRYDYRNTILKISREIASVIKIEGLTKLIAMSFVKTMEVSEISFLLLDREREHFRSIPMSIPRYKRIEIDVESPIVSWLSIMQDVLVRDEIEDEIDRQTAHTGGALAGTSDLEEVRDEMDRLGIPVWVPIISKEQLIGIIALGDKISGDIMTAEDIGLLGTLASQTAVALDNARLYAQVVNMKDYNEEILQSMVSGVMTVDQKERIVTFNVMAEKITGRKIIEVLGKSCEEIWGEDSLLNRIVTQSFKEHCFNNHEAVLPSSERGAVPVSIASTLLRDHDGKKIGVLITILDLTEIKQLEEKVRRADKLAALATMGAGMAHEIKNPLSSMKVFAQLLPTRFNDPEYRKKLEEILPREIDRIDRIVESLLSFARASALTFAPVKIDELLDETIADYKEQAKSAKVKVEKSYASLPPIEVDRGQLSQVFSNLVLNALQAMPEGGALRVMTLEGDRLDGEMKTIKVVVSDSGPGISKETQKRLFDPFYTTKYGGTGLGLTISHSIVDGHRGFIDLESEIGKGTSFTISLPVRQRGG